MILITLMMMTTVMIKIAIIIITRKIIGGFPISAIAVDNFRLFPPLYDLHGYLAYDDRPSFLTAHEHTCMMIITWQIILNIN